MAIQPGDIISYREMCSREDLSLQKGMNFDVGKGYSIILMSTRKGAPYNDRVEEEGKILEYEGHDVPSCRDGPNPKTLNQELHSAKGSLTENGRFFNAVTEFKIRKKPAELVRVYEKIKPGIWVYNGMFRLIDAWQEDSDGRRVYKFKLEMVFDFEEKDRPVVELEHSRIIPTKVKVSVWKRDKARCVICGSKENLHFDHIIPYSKGGSSLVVENIQLLCARHNIEKRDKIF